MRAGSAGGARRLIGAVSARLAELVVDGRLERDAAQLALAERLDDLAAALGDYRPARATVFGRLLGARAAAALRGVYIHGDVGRGKTLIMDLFFAVAPIRAKRRLHFHAFMADVHARIHQWRQSRKAGKVAGEDPIAPVAAELAQEAWLLCFDEFSVRDIADAMILARLFGALFDAGVVLVATSNVSPDDLYLGGLNRALFLPFIALLRQRTDVVALEARTDFRLEKINRAPVYYCPPDARATAALDAAFLRLTGAARGERAWIDLLGRSLLVPQAADGVARFGFDDLCRKPLGAADFLAIARHFHTVLIDAIRVMSRDQRNEAKRFINLIDTLYDQRVKLIASAEAEPDGLFAGEDGFEAFEFHRTASRLIEMRSAGYLALPHGAAGAGRSGDLAGLVDT
jgi:cell division protein ZapE